MSSALAQDCNVQSRARPRWHWSPLCAFATAAAAADQDLSVTIYADDLALVQDHRTIDLTGGKQRLEFENVSAQDPLRDRLARRQRRASASSSRTSTTTC